MSPEKDPVCGMNVPSDAKLRSTFEGKQYVFCSPGCKQKFDQNPRQYAAAGKLLKSREVQHG